VRECCFEYAKTMLSHYDTELLEKHARVLSDMIRVRWGALSLSSHPSLCRFRSHSLLSAGALAAVASHRHDVH
jgi:hypothetical protein